MINAMKMALEALENGGLLRQKQAITALRQAIVEAEKQAALDGLVETSREIERPVKSYTGGYPQYATDDRYTKQKNVYTSAERVHEIDKSIHKTPDDLLRQSEREGWRYAKECEAEVKRLTDLNRQLVAAAKELGAADDVHEWDDAWAKMAKLMRQGEQNATSSQDGR